jgi:hypothetical protein
MDPSKFLPRAHMSRGKTAVTADNSTALSSANRHSLTFILKMSRATVRHSRDEARLSFGFFEFPVAAHAFKDRGGKEP